MDFVISCVIDRPTDGHSLLRMGEGAHEMFLNCSRGNKAVLSKMFRLETECYLAMCGFPWFSSYYVEFVYRVG